MVYKSDDKDSTTRKKKKPLWTKVINNEFPVFVDSYAI
ncbi:MAG: hypothetical protein ACJAWH_000177 [Maribacter sp.]|jgi:hypothetical protein